MDAGKSFKLLPEKEISNMEIVKVKGGWIVTTFIGYEPRVKHVFEKSVDFLAFISANKWKDEGACEIPKKKV